MPVFAFDQISGMTSQGSKLANKVAEEARLKSMNEIFSRAESRGDEIVEFFPTREKEHLKVWSKYLSEMHDFEPPKEDSAFLAMASFLVAITLSFFLGDRPMFSVALIVVELAAARVLSIFVFRRLTFKYRNGYSKSFLSDLRSNAGNIWGLGRKAVYLPCSATGNDKNPIYIVPLETIKDVLLERNGDVCFLTLLTKDGLDVGNLSVHDVESLSGFRQRIINAASINSARS